VDFFFWRHLFVNSLFTSIEKFQPEKVVLAFDQKPSWRYEIFKDYKNKRKGAREKTKVDFKKFFPIFNDFTNQIKEVFSTLYVINVDRCEADDVIAVLCKGPFKNNKVTIISSDGDLNQLITDNIKQYDPIKRKIVNCLNPSRNLELKVITGDKSDDIPPIKPKVGIKTAEKILTEGLTDYLNKDKEIKDNYARNRKLIDLNYIPEEYKENIINTYNNYELSTMESKKILDFFVKNKLLKLMNGWEQFSDNIKKLS